jgi:hypothetical protein
MHVSVHALSPTQMSQTPSGGRAADVSARRKGRLAHMHLWKPRGSLHLLDNMMRSTLSRERGRKFLRAVGLLSG